MLDARLEVRYLGRCAYREAWALQQETARQRLAGTIPDTLLLVEHPPTITLGRAADAHHLLTSRDRLLEADIELVESDRGGDITYHGPGQLVGYPIFNLRAAPHQQDLHLYLRNIEQALIEALSDFGIAAGRMAGLTGVWVRTQTDRPAKVAAIGVKVSRWVTMHGFGLNVNTDLSQFEHIVPCGISQYGVTSISQELGREVTIIEVIPPVVHAFSQVFGFSAEWPE